MSLANCRSRLKSALETVAGLYSDTVWKEPPPSIGALPAAVIDFGKSPTADYVEPGSGTVWNFRLVLLLANFDPDTGYGDLDKYLEREGDYSIKQKVESYTIADYAIVKTSENAGLLNYRGSDFIGAEFTVEVYDTL